ncbi:hypothetical protein M378DRAFT_164937 [Amanita muscaria Koide BX008]|uniref:Uncharacterized protein n=1 Tax=Amanita muscaria (strain Koide BX008) TaxID=946122 RepID=A0A0C2X1N8_AMAMK|nr:hypothetical protein M378DRAFT_164937 [Amanita muscaria Koide BX008]
MDAHHAPYTSFLTSTTSQISGFSKLYILPRHLFSSSTAVDSQLANEPSHPLQPT